MFLQAFEEHRHFFRRLKIAYRAAAAGPNEGPWTHPPLTADVRLLNGIHQEEKSLMPFVRIGFIKGKPEGFGQKVADVVYQTMVETINVPPKDNFQVITEHDRNRFIYDPGYLNIPRTDGLIFIQITLNEGRTVALKKALYRTLAERLNQELSVRMEDVFINLVEVRKENWSFGNGIAQYAE